MATDIFAKIGDIKGESLDSKHKNEIEVLSFSWGVANSGSAGSGSGSGLARARVIGAGGASNMSSCHAATSACMGISELTGTHARNGMVSRWGEGSRPPVRAVLTFRRSD